MPREAAPELRILAAERESRRFSLDLVAVTPGYRRRWLLLVVMLLFLQFGVRVYMPLALPGYADESLHLRRAEVAWEFTDSVASFQPGNLLLYYYLGLFETDRTDFLLVSRLMVALFSLLGGAALYAVGKRLFQAEMGLMALLLYAVLPFTVFHDRMALADPLATALLLVVVWRTLIWLDYPTDRQSLIVGAALILPPLAKLTALGGVLVPLVAVGVFRRQAWREYGRGLALIYGVWLLAWGLLLAPTLLGDIQGGDERVVLVNDYLLNAHEEDQGFILNSADNLWTALQQTARYYWGPMLLLTGLGALVLLWQRFVSGAFLLLLLSLAWGPTVLAGAFPRPRHLELGIPFLLLMLVAGVYAAVDVLPNADRRAIIRRAVMMGFLMYSLSWGGHFMQGLYNDPATLNLPTVDQWRYIRSNTAGYGQQEATAYLEMQYPEGVRVYGVLGACHLMRLYLQAPGSVDLTCANWDPDRVLAPSSAQAIQADSQDGDVYLLLERDLGVHYGALAVQWEFVRLFPRPLEGVALELWRITPHDQGQDLPPRPVGAG